MYSVKRKIASFLLALVYFFTSSVAPVLAAISYSYDANGNMTSDSQKCYTYNEANQLSKVTDCATGKTIAEYIYDFEGNRVVKKEFQTGTLQKTVFSPSDDFETVKLASNGAKLNTTYYFVNGQLLAKKNPDGTKNFFHNDHLGSTSLLTSSAGAVVEETSYDPWGNVKTGGTKSKFLYTGQEKDVETGLNYYNARYYNSKIQHFTQPDDIIQDAYSPQTLNRYSYVTNNPIRYTDPTGHFFFLAAIPLTHWVIGAFLGTSALYTATPQGKTQVKTAVQTVVNIAKNSAANTQSAVSNAAKSAGTMFNNKTTPNNPAKSGPSGGSPQMPNMNPLQKTIPLVPPAAYDTMQRLKDNAGKPLQGYVSKVFENRDGFLPKAGSYIEHDIYPKIKGIDRGTQRLVIDTKTGKTWFTSDHYTTLNEIK